MTDRPRIHKWDRRASAIGVAAAVYAIAAGVATLVGWAAGIRGLTDWAGSGISMFPNAALAAVGAGSGVLLIALGLRRGWIAACGGLAFFLGAATLLEHLTGVNFGIDTLLFSPAFGQRAAAAPMRMGPPASVSFTVLGGAIILGTLRPAARRWSAAGAMAAMAITLLSLAGYLYGASTLYSVPRWTGIAAQTSTIIFAIGLGLLAVLPDTEPMRTLRSDSAAAALVRRALPWIVILPILLGWMRILGQNAGLYDVAFGTALRSVIEVVLLGALLWWTAAAVRSHEERLRRADRQLAAELDASKRLHRVSSRLIQSNDVAELYEDILDAAVAVMGSAFGSLQVLEGGPDGSSSLLVVSYRGFNADDAREWVAVGRGPESACAQALQLGERVIVPDVSSSAGLAGSQVLALYNRLGIRAVQATPLKSRTGRMLGMISTHWQEPHEPPAEALRSLDVLARQAADLVERSRHETDLQRRIEERTAELEQAHQDLRRNERLAAMGTLAAGLGHDLGNLMLPLRLRVDALERQQLPVQVREEVAGIRDGLSYLQGLANSLRQMAADADSQAPPEGTDLTRWMQDARGMLRATLSGSARLECDIPPGLPAVNVPVAGLTQAVFNLVQNAGEALATQRTANGVVRVSAQPSGAQEGWVELVVADNGPGLSPAVAARCFEPYFSTKGRAVSTGLGLALVRGVAEAAGGRAECTSTLGGGATFTLYLPPARAASTAAPLGIDAAVSLRDPRAAAVAAALLRSQRLSPRVGGAAPHQGPAVWVTDEPAQEAISSFLAATAGTGGKRVAVVLREGDDYAAQGGCAIHIGPKPATSVFRSAIQKAVQAVMANGSPAVGPHDASVTARGTERAGPHG